jgi:transcriptional regulator with XRE-family HTH domain
LNQTPAHIVHYSLQEVFLQGSIKGVMDLAAIRRASGLTQTELATTLGVGQAQVSKVERQDDMLISTLASFLAALGADAQICVEVAGQTVTYDLTAGKGT